MSFILKLRDFFRPRKDMLRKAGKEPNATVFDFGCEPGRAPTINYPTQCVDGRHLIYHHQPSAIKQIYRGTSRGFEQSFAITVLSFYGMGQIIHGCIYDLLRLR